MEERDAYRELLAINRAIASAADYDEVLRRVVDQTAAFTRADACLLLLVQSDGRARIARSVGVDRQKAALFAMPLNERIDRELCELLGFEPDDEFIGVPVVGGSALLGVLAVHRKGSHERASPSDDQFFLSALADQAAIALENAKKRRHETALLDALFETAPVGLATFDTHMRFLRVNPALARMNGLSAEDHVGKTPFEILPGVPAEPIAALFRLVLDSGQPVLDFEISGETPASPGTHRHWTETWFPVSAGDETLGVGAIVREITAEKEAEEFRTNVLGIVGHDLRSPLGAISTAASLLLSRAGLDEPQVRAISRISSSVQRMNRIIEDLLDFTRAQSAQNVPLNPRPTHIGELCAAVLDEMESSRPLGGFQVEGSGDPNGDWDPDRLAQALGNLVANAVKYCTPEKPVRLSWNGQASDMFVEVHNFGPPVPPQLLPNLFRPFRQGAQTASRSGGLGLGLFIARQIAVAHGGDITARSDEATGTTFTLRLPRRLAKA